MVDVRVNFQHQCADATLKSWSHEFNIKRGSTIRKLKEVMVAPNGTKDDVNAFELTKNGRRVRDFLKVWQPGTFDFAYLGQEAGAKKAAVDEALENGTAVCIGGNWRFSDSKNSSAGIDYIFFHEPGSKKITGQQKSGSGITDGYVDGTSIRWTVDGYKCSGIIEDQGRTISQLEALLPNGKPMGVYIGRRLYDEECWTKYSHCDLRGKEGDDVETLPGSSAEHIEAAKRRVEKMAYTGFSVWHGTAFLKSIGKRATKDEVARLLTAEDESSEVNFYLFTPPDPFEEEMTAVAAESAEAQAGLAQASYSGMHGETQCQVAPQHGHEARAKAAASTPATLPQQPEATATPPPPAEVDVKIIHAMEDQASEMTVRVSSQSSVMDVRRAAIAALGEPRLSEVRLVKKVGKNFTSLLNEEHIGSRREFLAMGRKLEVGAAAGLPKSGTPAPPQTVPHSQTPAAVAAPPPSVPVPVPTATVAAAEAPSEEATAGESPAAIDVATEGETLEINIVVDADADVVLPVEVASGSTVATLKQIVADMDVTGQTKAEDVLLKLAGSDDAAQLADNTRISRAHLQLALISAA